MTIEYYFKYYITEVLNNPVTWYVILATILLPVGVSFFLKKTHGKIVRRLGFLAFSLYVIYAMTMLDRLDSGVSEFNLDLFWTWERAMDGSAKHQYFIVGNILLFVPYGIAVSAIFSREKRRWWKALIIGAVTSAFIELAQYVWQVGLCELDDLIHNTIGMMMGYVIVKVCSLI